MERANFIHLHVHTEYSLLDGAIRLRDLFRTAKEYRMPAIAMTDHGNMFGAVDFYQMARQNDIKPIIGCEVYVAPKNRSDKTARGNEETAFHLVLLAQNREGYKNLCRLVTAAYFEGFYYKPRVDKELLERYNAGLIAMSSCLHGEIPFALLHEGEKAALEKTAAYARIFPDRFYLELQENGIAEQKTVNSGLKVIADRLSLPLVATNDCHYLRREDARVHDVLLCVQTGKTVGDQNRMRFSTDQLYLRSPAEMESLFSDTPEALQNTVEIARRCNLELELGEYHFPVYPVPEGETLDSKLAEEAKEGLNERLEAMTRKEGPDEKKERGYRERLAYELDVIRQMGFSGYFLIVSDFINYAKKKGVPVGPGRGSAAGSLVAYALRITDIDPLPYDLLFERFLNLERRSMPDIDVDFCKDRREEVLEYISQKYGGKDYTAQIITFGKMQARAVIRDVGRAMSIPYGEVDRIAKLIPNQLNIRLEEALGKEPRLRELAEQDPRVKDLITVSMALEGLPRHASTHAAGVVISDRPIVEYLPLYRGPKGEVLTQYHMKAVDKIGLVKFDLLGLKNLTIIRHAQELIRKEYNEALDFEQIPLDDQKAYELLSRGDTTGVFQLESAGMKELLIKMKPQTFTDLIASVALYRPGPLESGMVDDFVKGKHGQIEVSYPVPQLEEILKETYGVIVYQEQVMQIAGTLANYSMGDADVLRAAMGKKIPEIMAAQREKFVTGATKNSVPRKKAEKLFDLMEKFGGYGFNKSHSTAYALIAYQTAYLKAHYPLPFMAALLTSDMDSTDNVVKHIAECREHGIEILPPDINESDSDFSVVKGKIRFGLAAVKNVGMGAIDSIIAARTQEGPFTSLENFCLRVDLRRVNRRVTESLIKAGAFDYMGARRAQLFAVLDDEIGLAQSRQRQKESSQMSIFSEKTLSDTGSSITLPIMEEWPRDQLLNFEKEALGLYISEHPLNGYTQEMEKLVTANTVQVAALPEGKEVTLAGLVRSIKEISTRNGERMAFLSLEDLQGVVEIVVFADSYRDCQDLLKSDKPLLVKGKIAGDERGSKIIASEILGLSQALEKSVAALDVRLSLVGLTPEKIIGLKNIVEGHKGHCPLFLHFNLPGKGEVTISLPSALKVAPSAGFIKEIEAFLGYPAVQNSHVNGASS
ncbi:MAG: DNA polymerase III subunit alpha [Desulfovibrionales bacterium]|nr:DNA polymerase III subunit alpha [Desulfovibrionales bacterium]